MLSFPAAGVTYRGLDVAVGYGSAHPYWGMRKRNLTPPLLLRVSPGRRSNIVSVCGALTEGGAQGKDTYDAGHRFSCQRPQG